MPYPGFVDSRFERENRRGSLARLLIVTHFCDRSMRRRFCPIVRVGDFGVGGGENDGPCEPLWW